MLMRQTDDYLYITPNLGHAQGFLKEMYAGHPEYGCFVAKDKTLTNFDIPDGNLMNVLDPGVRGGFVLCCCWIELKW